MARKVMIGEVSRKWVRGRQMLGWMDGVNVVLGSRGITLVCSTMHERFEGVESPGAHAND